VCINREVPLIQTKADLWHSRIGHQGHRVLNEINTQFKINLSLSDLQQAEQCSCLTCIKGKITRAPIHSVADPQYKAEYPLQCLHADLVGPVTIVTKKSHPRCPSIGGSQYALIVTDEFTHTVWTRLLVNKSQAASELNKLINLVQGRTGRLVERFHIDGGGEFRGTEFRDFLDRQGTRFTHTTASTPQHNGVAERMNRTLFEMSRTLLIESQAPDELWGEALLWATHLYNVTPHPISNNIAPFMALYNYRFNIQKLRVWGCDAYVKLLPEHQSKIQSRVMAGVFVGYDYDTSSYRIMDPITHRITRSNDVHFDEHSFTQIKRIKSSSSLSNQLYSHINPFSHAEELDDDDIQNHSEDEISDADDGLISNRIEAVNNDVNSIESIDDDTPPSSPIQTIDSEDPLGDHDPVANAAPDSDPDTSFTHISNDPNPDTGADTGPDTGPDPNPDTGPDTDSVPGTEIVPVPQSQSREVRELHKFLAPINPKYTQPIQASNNETTLTRYGRVTRSSQPIASNPNNYYSSDIHHALANIAVEHVNAAVIDSIINMEPKQYRDAVASADAKEWQQAMQEEMDSMKRLGVWKIIQRPKGTTTLKGRWVYKNKLGDNNQLIRRKARFVAKGFLQVHGRDFFETHSPVAKMKSIKLILSLVAHMDLELYQIDFDTAFLNANVEEDIYMEQPEGFHQGSSDMVCKLIKSIYGLKQASRNWNQEIDSFMKTINYTPLISDPCVYIKHTQNGFILLSLYVDDTIMAYNKQDKRIWERDKEAIASHYAIKDLGECEWILNMKISRDRTHRTMTLSQEAYVDRIIHEFHMDNIKISSTPASVGDLYLPIDGTDPQLLDKQQIIKYQSMVGALLYAANITRIDIAFIVGQLCRYTSNPCIHHMHAATRVFRYLSGTKAASLTFGLQLNTDYKLINVIAYSDANWGSDQQTGKSNSGGLIKFNGDIISWHSKRQKSVAQSSAESEYMALAETVKETLWYRSWIYEIFNLRICSVIKCDNTATIHLSKNDSIHSRSKHINIRYHLIRDNLRKGRIRIVWVSTHEQEADLLTKALGPKLFTEQSDRLLLF
jgi:transposase InsO family protein